MERIKRFICLLLAAVVFATIIPADSSLAATTVSDPIVDNGNGTATIVCNVEKDKLIIVMVENADKVDSKTNTTTKYYYKLEEGENTVVVPLTEGPGKYLLRLCQRLANGKAALLSSKEITLGKKDTNDSFDVAHMVVNFEIEDKFIEKAKKLTKNCKTDASKIKKIYEYVISEYSYDYEQRDIKVATSYYCPDNVETYSRGLGICYDISSLLAAMLRSVGVEAKVITGYTPNVSVYHAWNQVYDSKKKKWYTIDATCDMCLYTGTKKDKFTMYKKDSEYKDIVYVY